MAYKVKERTRVCKYCQNTYSTSAKHSRVCQNCYLKNHQRKIERNLFNEN